MNVKNLFLLLLLLVGFAACSSDKDDSDDVIGSEKATLTLKLKPQGGYATRADVSSPIKAWESESEIDSYVILLFRSDANQPIVLTGADAGTIEVEKLRTGITVSVYAFVNLSKNAAEQVQAVKKPDELPALIESLSAQATDHLTMASTAATVSSVLKEGVNSVTVDITRLVSRVQISQIKTDFSVAADYTVKINSLELANVKESSLLYTNGAAEVEGKADKKFSMTNQIAADKVLSNGKPFTFTTESDKKNGQESIPYGYVFENTNKETPTQVLLNATLFDEKGKEVSTRVFTVTINTAGAEGHTYVKRNYIYDLGLTFNDKSFEMAALVAKVTIVPWGKVHQSSEVD